MTHEIGSLSNSLVFHTMTALLDHSFHRFQSDIQSVGCFAVKCGYPQLVLAAPIRSVDIVQRLAGSIIEIGMPRLAVLLQIDGDGTCGVRKVIKIFDTFGHGGAIEEAGKGIALRRQLVQQL